MMRVHHIGYLVKKLERALPAFKRLGYALTQDAVLDEYRQARLCFLAKDGYVIELVSPVSKESIVAGLLRRLGNTAYHICYEVSDITAASRELQADGYVPCDEPHGAVALQNRPVCFLIHPYMGMVELLEKER